MRKLIIFSQVFLFIVMPLRGQSTWGDTFSNGDFTTNPAWSGDTSYFIVNAAQQLQLQAPGAGSAALVTESTISQNATWEWWQQMTFNPSSSNFAGVHFLMDGTDPRQPHNGYFVRIGGSPERRIHLFRQDGSSTTLLAESQPDLVNANNVTLRIRVSRDSTGNFIVAIADQGGQVWQTVAAAQDTLHQFSTHFGVYCQFTSTRADRFFFDDFFVTGEILQDTIPPQLVSAAIASSEMVTLSFDKALANLTLANFLRNQLPPDSLHQPDPKSVHLYFSTPFQSPSLYTFRILHLQDTRGNTLQDTTWQLTYYEPNWNSLVFTEIMANPSPVVQLPDVEYIEFFNTTEHPIVLDNWQLHIGSQIRQLPPATLLPRQFLVVYSDNHPIVFHDSIQQLQLPLSNTALTNSGQRLQLFSSSGVAIDSVRYSDAWYGNPDKRNGGWSLERIDYLRQCGGALNWTASTAEMGGTPGLENAVVASNPDTIPPMVTGHGLENEFTLWVQFSEQVSLDTMQQLPYLLQPGVLVASLTAHPTLPNGFYLHLNTALQKQQVYALVLTPIFRDCHHWANLIDTLYVGIPEFPVEGDVLLNEVLFHPNSGGSRFVELYNQSDKIIDIGQLLLCQVAMETLLPENTRTLAPLGQLLFPGDFLVITPNPSNLVLDYPNSKTEKFLTATLPSMNNTSGVIGVATVSLTLLDYLQYDADMHHTSIRNPAGVSLERIRPQGPPNDPFNWTSAAATAGYATPGFQNSQFNSYQNSQKRFDIVGSPFSPNSDGYRDVLEVHFELEKSGYVLHGFVFDTQGREVAHFVNNLLVSETGVVHWDGTATNGQLSPPGAYIILIKAIHPDGDSHQFKGVGVLGL